MNILYHHRTQAKGVERVHIQGVIRTLREIGHQVNIVSLINDPMTETAFVAPSQSQPKKQPGVLRKILHLFATYAPNFVFRLAEIFYNIVAFFKIRRVLASEKIDIIYERYAYFNFSGVLAAKLYKKPLILEVNIFTGLNDARDLALSSVARFIEKKVFQASDAIFVVSDYLKEQMIQRYSLSADKVHVHPNAVDPEQLELSAPVSAPCIEQIKPQSVAIAFLGRLLPWYKLNELVTVFSSIHKQYPDVQLILIGDGTERPQLERSLTRSGAISQVVFCGSVSHEQALAILKKCDIGVIPSTNLWGSPMKLFEYMGSELAVVAPDIGVINSIMLDNVHGKLFEYDNFKQFEQQLVSLINDRDMRIAMGQRAKQHILENHCWQKVSQHVTNVAEELLQASN